VRRSEIKAALGSKFFAVRDELSFKDDGRAWDEQTRAWNISQLGPKPFILNQSVALCFPTGRMGGERVVAISS
jgi:hypothetical protein